MTKETIEQQLSVYNNLYNMENAVQRIQDAVEDADLELGNIVCLFTYRRSGYLEVSPFTCPNGNVEKLKFEEL